MGRTVKSPPPRQPGDWAPAGGWWHETDSDGRIQCDLCPRHCSLKPGDRGFCFVRQNVDGRMVLATYGRSTGFCIDPIEKKPLNHFLPGTAVLSFGTAGCNLGCKFCQNWESSKSRAVDRASEAAEPEAIAEAAAQLGCHSVAFTYNDPVIWAEYAIDTARACRARNIKTVAVTAGYITADARGSFYEFMDAANVDLKALSEDFYYRLSYAHMEPVLDGLAWLKRETDVWFEITNLVIPDENDAADAIRRLCDWVLEHVGNEVPVHFTAFHPDFRMLDHPATPLETLLEAYDIARTQGLRYVYVGNVHDPKHHSTFCPTCNTLLIGRDWHTVNTYHLQGDCCPRCATRIAGRFLDRPGDWGSRRMPVRISQFATALSRPPAPASAPTAETTRMGDSHMANTPEQDDPVGAVQASGPYLSDRQQQLVLRAACEMVVAGVCQRPGDWQSQSWEGAAQLPVSGAFVTLKRGDQLRACCGYILPDVPLIEALQQAAHRTATDDVRLPPISRTELPYLQIDVSIMHNFQPMNVKGAARAAAVEVGRHGLTIHRAEAGGLLLPIVAVENNWDAETFLRHVCRKAGLPTNAWQDDDARLQTFEAVVIQGRIDPESLADVSLESPGVLLPEDIQRLAEHCRWNVGALVQGATPSYYLPTCPDGNVQSVALWVRIPKYGTETTTSRVALRPGVPLQSTLYQCAESAAQAIRSLQLPPDAVEDLQADVAVLYDSALHGTVAQPDLRGVDPQRRAVMVLERGRYAWAFDRDANEATELLATAVERVQVMNPSLTSIISLVVESTCRALAVSNLPRPQRGPTVRPPAVAGVFYPDAPAALEALVDELVAGDAPESKARCPAVMVPHAGLRYSGRIAADVYRRIEIPSRVIIVAPKHSRLGTPWAVAPHDKWSIPGHEIPSDPDLARRLADAIPGLELDAAAHREEHAIEVHLPLLARLAPSSAVVGIAIGDGDLERCQRFARQLADLLRTEEDRPLLVISSDLNHYAALNENRQLDRLALEAMQRLDPAQLYATVRDHDISMCGVLPATIVMETLRQLDQLTTCREIAYATSADAGGSSDRVVGYAGLLLG